MSSARSLYVHVSHVHKEPLKGVPNSIEGRDSLEINIYGMNGVPPDLLERKLRELESGNGSFESSAGSSSAVAAGSRTEFDNPPKRFQPVIAGSSTESSFSHKQFPLPFPVPPLNSVACAPTFPPSTHIPPPPPPPPTSLNPRVQHAEGAPQGKPSSETVDAILIYPDQGESMEEKRAAMSKYASETTHVSSE